MTPTCPVCGCSRPIWTKELPTEPGFYYYWWDVLEKDQLLVVQIAPTKGGPLFVESITTNHNLYFYRILSEMNGEWIGPLPKPKKRR